MEKYQKPRTIAELLEFCQQYQMPLRQMRFFIGEDYPEARAFGIFQGPDGDFVVYKNKDDGSRAVRYKGPDEAYAVNEIYEKLKAETEKRRNAQGTSGRSASRSNAGYGGAVRSAAPARPVNKVKVIVITVILAVIVGVGCRAIIRSPSRGYYRYNDNYYYYDTDDWFFYDDGTWGYIDEDELLFDDYNDYYVSGSYEEGYGIDDFSKTTYYSDYYDRHSSDDNYYDDDDDYDWGGGDYDYGGWDAGDTDWNTDW
ncbi:MAG: hypothetical protein IKO27_01010 [Ruminococcus sp.]|nr:hypothetical protein [Ruminococcus sp.]